MGAQAAEQVVNADQGIVRRVAGSIGDINVINSDPLFLEWFNKSGPADSASYRALSKLSGLLAESKEKPFVFVEGQNIGTGDANFSQSDRVSLRSLFPNVTKVGFPEKLTEAQLQFVSKKNFGELLLGAGLARYILPADLPFAAEDKNKASDPNKFANRSHEELRKYFTAGSKSSDFMGQVYWSRYIPEYFMEKNVKDYFNGQNKAPVFFVINQFHQEFSQELTREKVGSTTYNHAGQTIPPNLKNTQGWRDEALSTLGGSIFHGLLK